MLLAEDKYKLGQMVDLFCAPLVKRGVDLNALEYGPVQTAGGGLEWQILHLKTGISAEVGKRIIKHLKDGKHKAQASIQGDHLRVSGKSRVEL